MSFFSRFKLAIKSLFKPANNELSRMKDKSEPLLKKADENEIRNTGDNDFGDQSAQSYKNDDHIGTSNEELQTAKDRKVHIKVLLANMTPEEYNRFYYFNSPGWSVTGRVKKTKQRRGGYVSPRSMKKTFLGQNKNEGLDGLNPDENIAANLIGLAVDYLTRVMIGEDATNAFKVSLLGASIIKDDIKAQQLISYVKGLNKESVISAVKLSGYDVIYRFSVLGYKPVDTINPNDATVENIITMVNRSLKFFERYGPVVLSGFDLEGGYTEIITNGDGDYLTSDTVWDFKVSKYSNNTHHTLQLLLYWRMGLHSVHQEFKNVKYLGIYNPRTNIAQRISVDQISPELINQVEIEIIGYRPIGKKLYLDDETVKRIKKRIFEQSES